MGVKITGFNVLKRLHFISYLVFNNGIPLFFIKILIFLKKYKIVFRNVFFKMVRKRMALETGTAPPAGS